MKKSKIYKKLNCLVIMLICGFAITPCFAGVPAPEYSELELLEVVNKLKASKDEIMPGDNFPRRLRLAGALYALGKYYNNNKLFIKADLSYDEMFDLISGDKSAEGIDMYRFYSDTTAKDYMQRGDLAKAKKYIDIALQICRTNTKEREVLPGVLTTLADWQKQMKKWDEAESSLLEAIHLLGDFAFNQRIELANLYLETAQLEKAEKTINELEKSKYAGSATMVLRAKWLRAKDRISEADELDTRARVKETQERMDLEKTL